MTNMSLLSVYRSLVFVLVAVVVTGCAAPGKISPEADAAFQRTGRFAVSVTGSDGTQDAVQGGFAWLDTGRTLTLDLSNPLGSTLARIVVSDGVATLTHSNGAREYAPHADALAEKIVGSPVPVADLRDWLRGRTGGGPVQDVHEDRAGLLTGFVQNGWRVQLSRYDGSGPTLLQMNRHDAQREIRVRLAISTSSAAR